MQRLSPDHSPISARSQASGGQPRDHHNVDILGGQLEGDSQNQAHQSDMHDTHETLVLRGDEENLHSFLDIVVNSDRLCLKGSGGNIEQVLLTGHVVLQLVEPTSIKAITLHFRGKVKMPPVGGDSVGNTSFSYSVCEHDWSFLEGEKKHGHTLKAGRHIFPFRVQIGSELPPTLSTYACGGASVQYKLRATASRPGFLSNFQAVKPIYITHSFTSTALEYQQSLEIENTWPGKLMYLILLPHKAWAAGDTVTSQIKFSPVTKGVKVLSISSLITETVKLHTRFGLQETTKTLVTVKHTIVNGKAIQTHEYQHKHRMSLLYHYHNGQSSTPRSSHSTPSTPSHSSGHDISPEHTLTSYFFSAPPSPNHDQIFSSPSNTATSSHIILDESQSQSPVDISEDVDTIIQITIPGDATPSCGNQPIMVSHRIKWNIVITNPDGHTSELRCGLPLHILDHSVLREAQASTAATRRLLLGGPEGPAEQEDEMQLPSYPSHIRDLVPDISYGTPDHVPSPAPGSNSSPATSPGHLPFSPNTSGSHDTSANRSLAWVNSELLRQQQAASSGSLQPRISRVDNNNSRRDSRASSPEPSATTSGSITTTAQEATRVHSSNSSRNSNHSIFHLSMKPFTSLSRPFTLSSRNSSSSDTNHSDAHVQHHDASGHGPSSSLPEVSELSSVPDYEVASRGFAGGGITPLSSLSGLPSYEEASHPAV